MAHKSYVEEGVKQQRRKGSDKQRRSFELNGKHSTKHLRLREAHRENQVARQSNKPETSSKKK